MGFRPLGFYAEILALHANLSPSTPFRSTPRSSCSSRPPRTKSQNIPPPSTNAAALNVPARQWPSPRLPKAVRPASSVLAYASSRRIATTKNRVPSGAGVGLYLQRPTVAQNGFGLTSLPRRPINTSLPAERTICWRTPPCLPGGAGRWPGRASSSQLPHALTRSASSGLRTRFQHWLGQKKIGRDSLQLTRPSRRSINIARYEFISDFPLPAPTRQTFPFPYENRSATTVSRGFQLFSSIRCFFHRFELTRQLCSFPPTPPLFRVVANSSITSTTVFRTPAQMPSDQRSRPSGGRWFRHRFVRSVQLHFSLGLLSLDPLAMRQRPPLHPPSPLPSFSRGH